MAAKSILDSLTPKQRIALAVAVLVVGGIVLLVQYLQPRPAPQPQPQGEPGTTLANRHIRFGMPADAKPDPAQKDAYFIDRPQYALSYNDSRKTPNWVCWNLTAGDIGNTPRSEFAEDPDLPAGFRRVKHGDYTGFGFDRGHLCPAKDRSDTVENNRATFYMTNMMPQAPDCNQKGWEALERYCRDLAKAGNELYIAAGPYGQGGTGTEGFAQTVGRTTKVVVPSACWKVVLVLPNKDATPTAETRAIGAWFPNEQKIPEAWKPYVVPVSEIETKTGFKFFPLVPDDAARAIKARTDRGP